LKADLLFHQKITVTGGLPLEVAVAELRVFSVPVSLHYPDGIKYSLFLVSKPAGRVIVGFDNHRPKGPHVHVRTREIPYDYRGVAELVEDFWRFLKKEGYQP